MREIEWEVPCLFAEIFSLSYLLLYMLLFSSLFPYPLY